MSKFKFVVVAKDDNFKMPIEKFGQYSVDVYQVPNNKEPLSKVYNSYLKKFRIEQEKTDFIVFMHADVEIDIDKFAAHVEECKYKYDVIGLCGTSIMNVSQSPLNWWTASNPTPEAKWGCVTHGELGDQKSFFNAHHPEVKDHEVACIDGLCIIFGPKAIASDIKFDEQFLFDCYDTDISLQTVLNYKFKLGVIVEESLKHYSVGRSIMTVNFLMNEIDLRKKWQLGFPPNSQILQLAIASHKL